MSSYIHVFPVAQLMCSITRFGFFLLSSSLSWISRCRKLTVTVGAHESVILLGSIVCHSRIFVSLSQFCNVVLFFFIFSNLIFSAFFLSHLLYYILVLFFNFLKIFYLVIPTRLVRRSVYQVGVDLLSSLLSYLLIKLWSFFSTVSIIYQYVFFFFFSLNLYCILKVYRDESLVKPFI